MSYETVAGIVLGASPEDLGLYRVRRAAELYHNGMEVSFSGKTPGKLRLRPLIFTGKYESEALRDLAVNMFNVRREDTDLEDKSRSTAGSLYWVREKILPTLPGISWSIVTQEWHWDPRAKFLAHRFFSEFELLENKVLFALDERPQSEIDASKRRERFVYFLDRYFWLPGSTQKVPFLLYENVISEVAEGVYSLAQRDLRKR